MPRSTKRTNRAKRAAGLIGALLLSAAFAAVFFSAAAVAVLTGMSAYTPRASDVAVIPGAMSGSLTLYGRCDAVIALYRAGMARKIIATGARGPDENVAEAADAAADLLRKGVRTEDILKDDSSRNTYENLVNARALMRRNGYCTAVIVTDDFHLYRCVQTARKAGIDASGAVSRFDEPWKDYYTLREIWGVLYYAALKRI